MVALAYLPDIVAQLGVVAGWSASRLLGHSVLFAVAVSPPIAAGLMRLARVSFPRAFVTALLSLLVHDVLDLGQATDRAPWWPLSERPIGVELGFIPTVSCLCHRRLASESQRAGRPLPEGANVAFALTTLEEPTLPCES